MNKIKYCILAFFATQLLLSFPILIFFAAWLATGFYIGKGAIEYEYSQIDVDIDCFGNSTFAKMFFYLLCSMSGPLLLTIVPVPYKNMKNWYFPFLNNLQMPIKFNKDFSFNISTKSAILYAVGIGILFQCFINFPISSLILCWFMIGVFSVVKMYIWDYHYKNIFDMKVEQVFLSLLLGTVGPITALFF